MGSAVADVAWKEMEMTGRRRARYILSLMTTHSKRCGYGLNPRCGDWRPESCQRDCTGQRAKENNWDQSGVLRKGEPAGDRAGDEQAEKGEPVTDAGPSSGRQVAEDPGQHSCHVRR